MPLQSSNPKKSSLVREVHTSSQIQQSLQHLRLVSLSRNLICRNVEATNEGLQTDFEQRVFGQPFALRSLIPLLRHHYSAGSENSKALALSFHGSPGTGKNLVTQLIVKNLYKKGIDSQFFHFFSGIADFTKKIDNEKHKEQLTEIIENSLKLCEWSLFVFDEIDKVEEGILEVVKPFIDNGRKKNGVDYRNAMYIFISNIGESHIIDKSVEFWKKQIPREAFKLKEFQDILFAATFNEVGGLKYSTAVRSGLINLYLPFLPLERKHLKKCIIDESLRQNYTPNDIFIKKILGELDFGPEPEKIFASHGCKQIETKIVLQIAEDFNKDIFKFSDEL